MTTGVVYILTWLLLASTIGVESPDGTWEMSPPNVRVEQVEHVQQKDDTQACQQLPDSIYALTEDERVRSDTTLARALLGKIRRAHECIRERHLADADGQLAAWLLVNEVFALRQLDRIDDAQDVVHTFFDVYAGDAAPTMVAKMHMWQSHLHILRGDILSGIVSHQEAEDFAEYLPPVRRGHLMVNSAYFLWRAGDEKRGMEVARKAERIFRDEMGPNVRETIQGRLGLGKALHQQAMFLLPERPAEARTLLREVLDFYPEPHVDAVLVSLAESYVAEGRYDKAWEYFDRGQRLADTNENTRQRIRVRLKRGEALIAESRLDAAIDVLREARQIAGTSDFTQYDALVEYALGVAYEQMEEQGAALDHYRYAAAKNVDRGDEYALRAKHQAQAAVVRLLETRDGWIDRWLGQWADWAIGGMLALGIAHLAWTVIPRRLTRRVASRTPSHTVNDAHDANLDSDGCEPAPPSDASSQRGSRQTSTASEQTPPLSGASPPETTLFWHHDVPTRPRVDRPPQPSEEVAAGREEGAGTMSGQTAPLLPEETASGDASARTDESLRRVLAACQTYVDLWSTSNDLVPEAERNRLMVQQRHRIFVLAMQWAFGGNVWAWMDAIKKRP